MTPKAGTLQEKMGFRDDDLATPAHDEMVIWLIRNKAWVASFLQPETGIWFLEDDAGKITDEFQNECRGLYDELPSAKTEVPVRSGNFIVGFVDVLLRKRHVRIWFNRRDAMVCSEFTEDSGDNSWAIEVKPKIRSFGETMRQIRHYQEFLPVNYAIFTPDLRFKDEFEEQGVKCFWKEDVAKYAASRAK